MVGGSCVLESKRHYPIIIGSLCCDERGFFLVIEVHADLVVAGKCIHKTEKFVARDGVHDEVDPGQREVVLRACVVYVSKVDTESPLAICFFEEHNISQPLRIFHLSDRSCLEELANLLVDGFLPF